MTSAPQSVAGAAATPFPALNATTPRPTSGEWWHQWANVDVELASVFWMTYCTQWEVTTAHLTWTLWKGELLAGFGLCTTNMTHSLSAFLSVFSFRYDPKTNQWSSDVAPTSTCRTSVGVAVLGGYLYAVGGQDGVSCLNIVERYLVHLFSPSRAPKSLVIVFFI